MLPNNAGGLLVFVLFLGGEIATMLLVKQCTFIFFACLVSLLKIGSFWIVHTEFSMWVGQAMHALLAFFLIESCMYHGHLTLVYATFVKMCGILGQHNMRSVLMAWLMNLKAHILSAARISLYERILLAYYMAGKELTEQFVVNQKKKLVADLVVSIVMFMALCLGVCFAIAWVSYRHYQHVKCLNNKLKVLEANIAENKLALEASDKKLVLAQNAAAAQKKISDEYKHRIALWERRVTQMYTTRFAAAPAAAAPAAAGGAAAEGAAAGGAAAGGAAGAG